MPGRKGKTCEGLYWLTPEDLVWIEEERGMSPEADRVPVSLNREEQKIAKKLGIKLEGAVLEEC